MTIKEVRYRDGDTECVGVVAMPAGSAKAPAVAVIHAWEGRDEFVAGKAEQFAKLGYIGFALDVYGGGKTGASPAENAQLMQPFLDDRPKLRKRLEAGVAALKTLDRVDTRRVAATGYCFGGLCALDLARTGADLTGVISNHGLFTPSGAANARIKARVLALHGYDDPMVPPEAVLAFAREMSAAGADWQLHAYGNTVHAFTNPKANDRSMGAMFDANADRRAWQSTVDFLAECFV